MAKLDIEADLDRENGLPTSVKTTQKTAVGLGDARSIWKLVTEEPFRMVVGRYGQFTETKVFGEIIEIVIEPRLATELLGSITLDEVAALHDGIGLENFHDGGHAAARRFAKREVARLKPRRGLISLNPKIDSARQRRLQCSLDVLRLADVVRKSGGLVKIHSRLYGDLALPFAIRSDARCFS